MYPLSRMFVKTARPTLPGLFEAPITAIDFGANSASRFLRRLMVTLVVRVSPYDFVLACLAANNPTNMAAG